MIELSPTAAAMPPRSAAAVTPNDSADLPVTARGLSVAVSGIVKVDMRDTGTAVQVYIAAGVQTPMMCTRVYSTDTTATGIVAWW